MKRFAIVLAFAATISAVKLRDDEVEAEDEDEAEVEDEEEEEKIIVRRNKDSVFMPLKSSFTDIANTSDAIVDTLDDYKENHDGFGGALRESMITGTGDVLAAVTMAVFLPLAVADTVASTM